MGYTVTAFATLEIRQPQPPGRPTTRSPPTSPDPGGPGGAHHHRPGRRLARIVARSNADLQRVIDRLLDFEGIVRTSTVIALATQIPRRLLPLLAVAAAGD